jgi:Putative beta-barrel porin 2
MNSTAKSLSAGQWVTRVWWMLVFLGMWQAIVAQGQQAFQNLMALNAYQAGQQTGQSMPQNYTIKLGDFQLLATSSLEMDWNDNVSSSQVGGSGDFIITPRLQLTSSYPITDRNVLNVMVGVGYSEYLRHSDLSSLQLQAGTGLSFDFVIERFVVNLHDYVSCQQDASQQPLVAGSGDYGSGNNRSGVRVARPLGALLLAAGYDHTITFSTTGQFQSQNQQADLIYNLVSYQVSPRSSVGTELTAAFTSYSETILNNNDNYSVGAFAFWRLGDGTSLQLHGGYALYQFQQTSRETLVDQYYFGNLNPEAVLGNGSIETSDFSSWYANVAIAYPITKRITGTLRASHNIEGGVQSDEVETYDVNIAASWRIVKDVNFATALSYEHGSQGVGNVRGNLTETYDWFAGDFSANYAFTKKASLGLRYRLTDRGSDSGQRGYTQNLVGLTLSYRFS